MRERRFGDSMSDWGRCTVVKVVESIEIVRYTCGHKRHYEQQLNRLNEEGNERHREIS